ncbi:MAG: FliO/MopB family protein [Planctomycetaceae bacterium]|nr:FliO/MopB family protein [Planctomycetaceae bacterium]
MNPLCKLLLLALLCSLIGAHPVHSADNPVFTQPSEFRNQGNSPGQFQQKYQQPVRSGIPRPAAQAGRMNLVTDSKAVNNTRTQTLTQRSGADVRKSESNPITPLERPKQTTTDSTGQPVSKRAPSIWGTFGALLVVISIILVGAKLFKKHHPLGSAGLPREVMEVLGKKPLDARQTIHFVRCGSRILILGSSPAGLEMLSEVVDPVEVDLITGMCREGAESARSANSFRNLFQSVQKKEEPRFRRPAPESHHDAEEPEPVRRPEQEPFADYDSAVSRLQQKLLHSPRQSLNERAESDHA